MRLYRVYTDGFDFLKMDSSIADVRRWAKYAFPKQHVTVSMSYELCEDCNCAPCVCKRVLKAMANE